MDGPKIPCRYLIESVVLTSRVEDEVQLACLAGPLSLATATDGARGLEPRFIAFSSSHYLDLRNPLWRVWNCIFGVFIYKDISSFRSNPWSVWAFVERELIAWILG